MKPGFLEKIQMMTQIYSTILYAVEKVGITDEKELMKTMMVAGKGKFNPSMIREIIEGKVPFSFEATAKPVANDGHVDLAVWTDGVSLHSDCEDFCAFPLKVGRRYRVTVEKIEDIYVSSGNHRRYPRNLLEKNHD